ncbi:MAG: PAS domain-containing protein [Methylacidiphilales bacterium]|nr:PAS domain-containing protein [Candidatus Methylacidiphilales bacterium]
MKKTTSHGGQKQQRSAVARKTAIRPTVEARDRAASRSFPIVGLGASAGGLEALEQFLGHVPKECGLGFVVVQHLDPSHKGILVELLQRGTAMPVIQIKDRMKVEPGHVYVIPPNRDLSILHGVLHLLEPAAPRGLRLPIDFFFRSLADDQHVRSIGVILSGMGSDGTLGLRAIKEKAGAVFVQTPASARFDSMPRMAIDAGLADVVAPAEELPGKIIDYLQHVPLLVRPDHDIADKDQSALEKVVILLRAQTGHDFSLYKKSTIYRRIERRMGLHQITRIADYVRYLRENSQESELLFKELLIGVTSFFRDPEVWEQLKNKIIPEFLTTRLHSGVLRAWTAGCSTGEEAYSLAIVFKEALEKVQPGKNFSLQIFATDLDKDAIDKARAGVYPANISADVSEERLRRFFVKNEHGNYSMKKEIREMVIFAPQNLVMHPPFTRLDFVTCRNLLIYLDADLQKKLMPLFHYSLNSGGILLLGSAETIGTATDLFTPLEGKFRLYRRLDTSRQPNLVEFPSAFTRTRLDTAAAAKPVTSPPAPNLQSLADQLLLQRYSPAAVLVTNQGDILYVSGKTGKYLEPAAGKANWNLFAMSREGLGNALSEAFHKAVRQKIVVTLKDVKVGTNGGTQVVDITVQPVTSPEALRGMVMVVFTDVVRHPAAIAPGTSERATMHNARLAAMAQELQQAHEDLQATRDEMQTSQEELKSTNEELQSMNEELQSTNEELTTSKEEMQSMNEELQTVNHELQAKVDELSRASNDMKNLLNSTDIATLFLDNALLVRRFTTQTAGIIKLIPGDVGRPITDIVTTLDYPRLAEDTQQVLKTLVFVEKQVTARDGRWFTVRIMPYCTQDNRIDGVVITFADITVAKNLEAALRKAQSDLEKRFTTQTAELGKVRKNLQTGIHQRAKAKPDGGRTKGINQNPKRPR